MLPSKPILEITDDNINIVVNLIGDISYSALENISACLIKNSSTDYRTFPATINYFTTNNKIHNMDFIERWQNRLSNRHQLEFCQNCMKNISSVIDLINHLCKNLTLVLALNTNSETVLEHYKGKSITLTYRCETCLEEIKRNTMPLYLKLIESFKENADKFMEFVHEYAPWMEEGNRELYYFSASGEYTDMNKGSKYVIKRLNEISNNDIFYISDFFLELFGDPNKMNKFIIDNLGIHENDPILTYNLLFLVLCDQNLNLIQNNPQKEIVFEPIKTKIFNLSNTI